MNWRIGAKEERARIVIQIRREVRHAAFASQGGRLAAVQGRAETGFAAQVPTVDAGSVMRLEVSCRLLILGSNAGSNTAGINPFLKRMWTGSLA